MDLQAMEVEKLEIAVDTLKKSLESSQQDVRDLERELRYTKGTLERTEKKLEDAERAMVDLKAKNADLKEQVKEELERNTQLEMRIENAAMLKEQLREQETLIGQLKKEAEEKSLVAQHARKCLRDEKEKSKDLEEQTRQMARMEQEVAMVRSENQTLKRLMLAKDRLVVQRSQIISNTKNALHSLPPTEPYLTLLRILDNKDTIPATFADSSSDEGQENRPQTNQQATRNQKYSRRRQSGTQRSSITCGDSRSRTSEQSSYYDNAFFLTALDNDEDDASNRIQLTNGYDTHEDHQSRNYRTGSADDTRRGAKTSLKRPRMYKDSFSDFRSDTGSTENVSVCSFIGSYNGSSPQKHSLRNSSSSLNSRGDVTDMTSRCSSASRLTEPVPEVIDAGDRGQQLETPRVTKCVRIGDRVVVDIAKKKESRKNLQPGVIRYLGDLDGVLGSRQTYVGLKLDEPCGDSDGIIKEKRYFRAPPRFGKIAPLNKIASVFDKDAGIYRRVESVTYDPPCDDGVRTSTPSVGVHRSKSLRS